MRRLIANARLVMVLGISLAGFANAAESPPTAADVVSGFWQHHKVLVNYFGITSAYGCDALEQHVKQLLLYLGARKDARVDANGCPRGPDVPSHSAWIQTDFYTLSPAETAASNDTVKAHWAPREITPRRPSYMGDGDCELIEQMKDLISTSFSLRGLHYQTVCLPHEIVVDGFSIKAQALIPVDQPSS